MAGSAVNIAFGVTITDFLAGIRTMRSEIGQFTSQLNTNLAAGFAAADRQQRIFDRGLGRTAGNMQTFGRSASVASAGLALLGATAFKSYAEIDGIQRALTVTTGSVEEAGKQFKEFRELAKLPGLGLEEVTQAGLQFETLGYEAKTAQKYVSEVGNAIALGGKGKAEFGSVITQFTQMSGKAKVLSEDLKPILTASPVISKAITDMFGTVDPEKISGILQAAGRGPKEFIDDLVKKLSQLERVSGGPKNAIENLSDSFTIAGYEAGKAADKAFGLTAKIEGLGNFVSTTATRFGELPPSLQAVAFGLVGTAAAIGPLALGLGSLLSLGPQFVRGFSGIGSALTALVSPVGVVTIAIGAALGAFLVLGSAISNYDANLETSADKAKLFATTHDLIAASIGSETSKLSALLGVARDETISKKARQRAIQDLNALSPQYLGNLSLETINTAQATRAINQYTTALRLKAKIQVLGQQAAETDLALDRARAKSAKDYVDNSRFSQDQIAINIKTTASFSPQADRAALFDQLGKDRKNAEVSRLADASKLINDEIKKAYADAVKQNITVEPPKVKITDYSPYFNGTASGIKNAKDALKDLAEEIASVDLQ
ncbi:tape measure protein [Spirosoma endophyticum]|uniref:Tape measure domain-containing protein n=1 Tax=Spirosoma endophyticum TaxID=662367 RepID=A0A1I2HAK4_9BACT|nr:tape measure protein [Spirosoma endophyticum]SFF25641.1 tape measure domain-containing protein [Spirosoma endophyticum]